MSGGAAGGFVTRSFESMLKECPAKKYPDLRKAIQAYIDNTKGVNQQPVSSKSSKAESGDGSSLETKDGAGKAGNESDPSTSVSHTDKNAADAGGSAGMTITAALASAGHTLKGAQVELVLDPLRLAFETKNLKAVEPALDCLHKLIAYNHLEGDPGLDGGKNAALFTDILNMVCGCVDNSSPDSTILHVLKVLLTAISSTKFRVHGEPLLGIIRVCYNIALSSKSPINQATSKAMLTQMINIVFRRLEIEHVGTSTDTAGQTEATSPENRISIVEATSEGKQNEREVFVENTLDQAKDSSLASVEELHSLAGSADIKGLEAVLDQVVHLEDGKKIIRGIDLESLSIGHRDALLVFRDICKMSMKEGNDEVTTKTRIVSLELLQGLLEVVSHSLTKDFAFIDSVKAYLSYALLRASVSQSSAIFQYATGIFSALLLRFRESLKGEIGVFFPLIVLRPLDGSDINQKMSILRMLDKVCKEPQMLVDIFVNYDCDPEAPNLFERMVTTLSKMAQGTQNADPNSVAMSQTNSVKGTSLQSLVNVLKSLIDWEKSRRGSEEQSKRTHSLDYNVSSSEITEIKSNEEAPNEFEKTKDHKSTMEAAISEFNRQPAKGVEYLISNKLVENTPSSVAQFLRNTPLLDKAMIGDYMGLNENFPLAVMHSYVDSMSFAGMPFHVAIREFLNGFRLPGEAEKIDRMMEKFAERYCADNPGFSKNADTAYVLAYAVILLNADAHNPMVWPKMPKSDFIRMNVMTDADDSAPAELLEEIYDSIVREEIQMKDDITDILKSSSQKPEGEERSRLVSILNLVLPKTKTKSDTKSESEAIIKQAQAIFKNHGVKRGDFYTSQRIELVRPMVEAVGWALLATFSVTMEEGDNKPRVILLMEGFKAGIHITYVLGMDTMRYASLTSLVRFTFLHAPKEMRGKNVEALRTLLFLCDSEPESLQETWNAVLGCVSRLEYITSTPSIAATVMHGSNQISRDTILQSLRELAGKPVDQVFANSLKLPSDSVVEFFTALCGVSAEELRQTPARLFSLQKLVETSYYNMARIRLVWARIWSVLANHFIAAGRHHDETIAMYSIDSLRQLSIKYLGREELANFTFQNDILKPFVVLMRNSQRESIRRLILECIVQMIKAKVGNIRSGWRSVFMVFTAAADDVLESIVDTAFENVELVVLEHFDQVVGDCFMDCVNCLIRFANNKTSHRISLKAIALLRICEDRLAEGLIPGRASHSIAADLGASFDVTEHYWFPMLAGLSDLTSDNRSEVRNCALEVLFDLLDERGSKFSSTFWESIFHRVLFPIFDHVRHAEKEIMVPSGDEWLRETSIHALQLLCNVFNTFYKEVSFILPSLLSLLLDCAKKTDQTVVSISMGALVHLIEVGGHQFSESDWDTLLKSIRDASFTTQPVELLNASDFDNHQIQTAFTSNEMNSLMSAEDVDAYNSQLGAGDEGKISSSAFSSVGIGGSAGNHDALSTLDHSQDSGSRHNWNESEDLPSPGGSHKSAESGGLQRSQTLGQRIMGNMMENLFLRNLTSKPRSSTFDSPPQPAPVKLPESADVEAKDESPLMGIVRSKCITQSLLLGTVDTIQKKFWTKLNPSQKVAIMEIVLSLLEFAASYNSYANLRLRMRHVPADRPPFNLLRQELAGTSIYLDILQKATSGINGAHSIDTTSVITDDSSLREDSHSGDELEGVAEAKLVSFCEQVLREACTFQSSVGDATNMDIHRVLELRSSVIIKVLKGMCSLNNQIFRRHMREFYPLLTKLVCCDQMDVRGALGDLFNAQLRTLLP